MADKDRKKIDPDELDELPDVVLSDETKAYRKLQETGLLDDQEETEDKEIPQSLQDDDPGVKNELDSVLGDTEETGSLDVTEAVHLDDEQNTDAESAAPTGKFSDYTKGARHHRHSLKRTIVWILLIVMLGLLGLGCYEIYQNFQPVSSTSEEVPFEIEENETLRTVCDNLEEQGIVRDADITYLVGRINNLTDLKHGAFLLDKSWSIEQILTTLNDQTASQADSVYITIIEGDWAKDAAAKIANATDVSYDELIALWSNADWLRSRMSDYPFITEDMFADGVRIYLEGYLAPNTYLFRKSETAEDITDQILDQTNVIYQKYSGDMAASSLSVHQIYTLASIIQYEAGTNPDDLANVASVFYNRLNADMPLQSSVTVCYAIDFDSNTDNWQACELNTDFDSPYNTYLHTGLPPGAIENAGENAIYAAIHPASTDYYYFMADVNGDGTIHYARTLEEHNANVQQYLQ